MLAAARGPGMTLALGTGSGLKMGLGVDSDAITPLIEKVGSSGDFGARQETAFLPMTRLTERVEDTDGSGSGIHPGCFWFGLWYTLCFWTGTGSETFSGCSWTGACSEMNS